MLPLLEPMLASTGPIAAPAEEWAFEPKLDGWRALVYVDGAVTVRTRRGRNVSASLPELEPLADALAGRRVVLDGELVARQGRAWDFYRLGPRLSAHRADAVARGRARTPVTFAIFDVLVLDGELVTDRPYRDRRQVLEGLALDGPAWCTVASIPARGPDMFVACVERGLEGVVAKRLSSRYRPGERSRAWIKCKSPDWRATHAPRRLTERARPA
jgi:bifunctional non-homologous end joining protein LigD